MIQTTVHPAGAVAIFLEGLNYNELHNFVSTEAMLVMAGGQREARDRSFAAYSGSVPAQLIFQLSRSIWFYNTRNIPHALRVPKQRVYSNG